MIRFFLRLLFLGSFIVSGAFASDELPQPLIIATAPQSETAQQLEPLESITVEINDLVSHAELANETPTNKKSRYLKVLESLRDRAPQKVRNIFTKLKLSKKFQEFVISDLEYKLNHAPDLIMTSNASGYGIRPTVIAGFGVSDYILDHFRKKSWGHLVPPFAHFGLGFGIGLGYLTYVHKSRRHIVLRIDMNAEHSLSMINWMGEAFAGVAVQKMSQQIKDEFMNHKKNVQILYNKLERSSLGPAGTMISQDGYFEHAFGGGVGFPPVVGMTSFYKFRIHQLQLNFKVNIQGLVDWKNKLIRSCRISVKGS
jgi:hypothetical protein